MPKPFNAGGQAVIEGVMMRTPKAMSIAVRCPSGEIIVKKGKWRSLWNGRALKIPFIRGVIVMFESLVNGISALNFSAIQAMPVSDKGEKPNESVSNWSIGFTMAFAFVMGIGFFVYLPHILTNMMSSFFRNAFTEENIIFHLIDGGIKMILFVAYLYGISRFKDIRRVFEYHGAEHMTIFAYEDGKPLTIESIRPYQTHHPRCGTSFLISVILISIVLFSLLYVFIPVSLNSNPILSKLILISIKIPLMFPIAGIAYELIRLAGKYQKSFFRILVLPGLWLQRITTKTPTDDQLEVAICSLKAALQIEHELGASIDPIYGIDDLGSHVKQVS